MFEKVPLLPLQICQPLNSLASSRKGDGKKFLCSSFAKPMFLCESDKKMTNLLLLLTKSDQFGGHCTLL